MQDKDVSEKLLEAYNDVFADIVNVFLFGGEQVVREEDLEDASPLSMYKADGELHEQERDVSKFWRRENITLSLIGLENQSKYERDMPLRIIGYDGAGYRAQLRLDAGLPPALAPEPLLVPCFGQLLIFAFQCSNYQLPAKFHRQAERRSDQFPKTRNFPIAYFYFYCYSHFATKFRMFSQTHTTTWRPEGLYRPSVFLFTCQR